MKALIHGFLCSAKFGRFVMEGKPPNTTDQGKLVVHELDGYYPFCGGIAN